MLLVLIGAIVLIAGPWIMRRRGMRGELAHGTLLVTGVSPRPDVAGEQFVTITGVINGPTVDEHVVYQRLAVDVERWPTMGTTVPGRLLAEESGQLELRPAGGAAARFRGATHESV